MSPHLRTVIATLGISALALTACAESNGDTEDTAAEDQGAAVNDAPEVDAEEEAVAADDDAAGEDETDAGEEGQEAAAATGECQFAPDEPAEADHDRDSLAYWAEQLDLKVGNVAAGGGHHEDEDYPDPFPDDAEYRDHLAAEYNSLTHENYLKWEFIQPEQGEYDFEAADAVVAFAQEHGIDMRGHALFWHSQNPEWLEEDDFSEEELREILEDHVRTVVSRYSGCI